jgi:hypothetical protein
MIAYLRLFLDVVLVGSLAAGVCAIGRQVKGCLPTALSEWGRGHPHIGSFVRWLAAVGGATLVAGALDTLFRYAHITVADHSDLEDALIVFI